MCSSRTSGSSVQTSARRLPAVLHGLHHAWRRQRHRDRQRVSPRHTARPRRPLSWPQHLHGLRGGLPGQSPRQPHREGWSCRTADSRCPPRAFILELQRLPVRRQSFRRTGVPDDDNGATVRAFTTFKGKNYLIAKNAIDLAMNGRTTTNWTGCIIVAGDQTFDPNKPQSQAHQRRCNRHRERLHRAPAVQRRRIPGRGLQERERDRQSHLRRHVLEQ